VSSIDRVQAILRVTNDAAMELAKGARGPDVVRDILERVATAAEADRASVAEPFAIEGHRLRIDAAIGISIFPEDAGDARSLLKHADVAMYAVKRGPGRGYLTAGERGESVASG
jgi:GGDEF domain-containing protein